MASRLESEIDQLYRLPPEAFTAARNALAKGRGPDGALIRGLEKPSLPAWAVNQLYWQDPAVWNELIAAAEQAQRANRAVLGGKGGDIRAAGKVHDEAVEKAVKATLARLQQAGHPVSDATRQAIVTTLRSLPSAEPPGRLSRPLQPGGFEQLAGLPVTGRAAESKPGKSAKPVADARAAVRARQAAAAEARARLAAEQEARRHEFERARAEREEQRAIADVEKAREAVARATTDLQAAEAAAARATTAVEALRKKKR